MTQLLRPAKYGFQPFESVAKELVPSNEHDPSQVTTS